MKFERSLIEYQNQERVTYLLAWREYEDPRYHRMSFSSYKEAQAHVEAHREIISDHEIVRRTESTTYLLME
jgi:hypothetical protein